MPLPKVPIGVFCLSAHNFGKADITRRRRVISLISDIPIRKIAPKSDFSCIYQKLVVPLHRIQSREAGAIPAQSRCCDSQSDVQILISHWLTVNCQLSTDKAGKAEQKER